MKKIILTSVIFFAGANMAAAAGPPGLVVMNKNYLKETSTVKTVNTCVQEKNKTAEVLNVIIKETRKRKYLKSSGNKKLYVKLKKHYKKLHKICPTKKTVKFFKKKRRR